MKLALAFAATLVCAQSTVLTSDEQAYAGLQFRVKQSFVDMVADEFFYELPYIINDVIAPLVPTQLSFALGFFQVKDIKVSGFTTDNTRAKFTIDEKKRGIMMNWAEVTHWNIHFKCLYILFWPFEYSFNVDFEFKNALLDNGLSLQADSHTGAPIVNFFNTEIDLGRSAVHLSGDFVIAIIGWFTNFFKLPIQVLLNQFFQPFINFAINDIIIPLFLNNGLFKINTFFGSTFQDTLVIDMTLPQAPVFHNGTMDVFNDGAIYFVKEGKKQAPTTPMRFQTADELNLQFVLSSFSVNSLVQIVLDSGLIQFEVGHELFRMLSGFDLTTTLLFPIVPELFFQYGTKNLTLHIQPIPGTDIEFLGGSNSTRVSADVILEWYIFEDATEDKRELAFTSVVNVDIALALQVNATKHVIVSVEALDLTKFNVTVDNMGGVMQRDQDTIRDRLEGYMYIVKGAINAALGLYHIRLPELQLLDYAVNFEY